jgi:outer membrane protein assembly factor BamB
MKKPSYIITFVFFLAMASYAVDWPAFRGNMLRTGYYSSDAGFPSDSATWICRLHCPVVSSPSIVNGIVYIGGRDSCIYAIEAATGKIVWRVKTNGWVDSSPLVVDGKVVVGSRDSLIYVLDAAQGSTIARFVAGVQVSSPAITLGKKIITGIGMPGHGVGGYDFSDRALGKKSGKAGMTMNVPFKQLSYSSPAVYGQAIVIGANDGRVYCVNGEDGSIAWQVQTEGGVYLSTPVIDSSLTVYFAPGENDESVYAIDLQTGKIKWRSGAIESGALAKKKQDGKPSAEFLRQLLLRSPQQQQEMVRKFYGGATGLKKTNGNKALPGVDQNNWLQSGPISTSSVAVDKNHVYVIQKAPGIQAVVTAQTTLYKYQSRLTLIALDKKDGGEAWRYSELRNYPRLGYCSSPIVTNAIIYTGWGEGLLYAFNKNGQKLWSDTLSADIVSSPAIADGHLYVATFNGDIYNFGIEKTAPGLDFEHSTFNYPNPATGNAVHIQVFMEKAGRLSLTIYSTADKPVFRLNNNLSIGKNAFDWDLAPTVANGVYYGKVVVTCADGSIQKKNLKIAVLRK